MPYRNSTPAVPGLATPLHAADEKLPTTTSYFWCWLIESTFPSGSLNQATLSPRRNPDAEFLILNEWIPFQSNSSLFEPARGFLDVLYFPSQNGVCRRNEIPGTFCDSKGAVARAHDQGERIFTDKLKFQLAFLKLSSLLGISRWNETDHFAGGQH
jgi:hypothetical protein